MRGAMLPMATLALLPVAAAAAAAAPQQPCAGAWSGSAWCAPGPPFEPRAAALVANLTRREKSGLILMIDLGVARLDISPYIWWSEARF